MHICHFIFIKQYIDNLYLFLVFYFFLMKNNLPIISVIIPVYNIENYVSDCVESILRQSYKSIEILLIDDGSTDGSVEICDNLGQYHASIKVYHQKNGGVVSARKRGVEVSQGEYVCFVDGDDTLPEDGLSQLYNFVQKELLDIGVGGYNTVSGRKIIRRSPSVFGTMTNREYISAILLHKIHTGPCARLFKRAIFDASTMDISPYFKMGEDTIMNVRLGVKASRVGVIALPVYNYIQRGTSVTNTFKRSSEYLLNYEREVLLSVPSVWYANLEEQVVHYKLYTLTQMLIGGCFIDKRKQWFSELVKSAETITCSRKENFVLFISQNILLAKFFYWIYQLKKMLFLSK